MKIAAAIVTSWAILYWPGLLVVAAADYFAPSALPPFLLFGIGLSALAYLLHRRIDR